jgi:hypothetical protein
MKIVFINFIVILFYFFIKCQNQEIPSIFLDCDSRGNISFELSILKDEIFEIKLTSVDGTGYFWNFINKNSFINNYIQSVNKPKRFLNEENIQSNKIPKRTLDQELDLKEFIKEKEFNILGDSSTQYEYYKALKITKEPIILNYMYYIELNDGNNTLINATIKLQICNELNDGTCIFKEEEIEEPEKNEEEPEKNEEEPEKNEEEPEKNEEESEKNEEEPEKNEENEKEEKLNENEENKKEEETQITEPESEEKKENKKEKFLDNSSEKINFVYLYFSLFYLIFLF